MMNSTINSSTCNSEPVIITGMHRSGTTLLSKLLEEQGVFLGINKDINNESIFFMIRNESILKYLGFGWHKIKDFCLKHEDELIVTLNSDLHRWPAINYLGINKYLKYKSIKKLRGIWGWKDPRNTVLLPIWLQIFPNAKIVNVIRNGIDVASSLVRRENARVNKIRNSNFHYGIERLIKKTDYLYVKNKYKVNPVSEHRPEITIPESFQIWVDYLSLFNKLQNVYKFRVFDVKYENLISNPDEIIEKINIFLGNSLDLKKIKTQYTNINQSRRFAFTSNPELTKYYHSVKNHWLMNKYGYSNISI